MIAKTYNVGHFDTLETLCLSGFSVALTITDTKPYRVFINNVIYRLVYN